ncbi:uncharacterized protein MYCFIDRAFT_207564 [Pseudocercospora fijiensis CIRAD86]|uniref:Uncharacterized protein n=1 Tax=Pseudocercospora fijiensis (strain CIRAD86) TaxID=383855 RepID=M2ZUG7_PSEFD|nr:uncharacterized protein MYCFIDRAFT_207564 [Pseudocercospora fijiensis CIRAD86]EME82649.1 hypothetical protein MYCFIDRAFT_207564 [Pseudocercospora fijiensis CIRAD86]
MHSRTTCRPSGEGCNQGSHIEQLARQYYVSNPLRCAFRFCHQNAYSLSFTTGCSKESEQTSLRKRKVVKLNFVLAKIHADLRKRKEEGRVVTSARLRIGQGSYGHHFTVARRSQITRKRHRAVCLMSPGGSEEDLCLILVAYCGFHYCQRSQFLSFYIPQHHAAALPRDSEVVILSPRVGRAHQLDYFTKIRHSTTLAMLEAYCQQQTNGKQQRSYESHHVPIQEHRRSTVQIGKKAIDTIITASNQPKTYYAFPSPVSKADLEVSVPPWNYTFSKVPQVSKGVLCRHS